jgi:peptidoglycan/xylan/chitin deacetylase (PgdA/CDA1 family)
MKVSGGVNDGKSQFLQFGPTTIIMYHYVRDRDPRYPCINGLSTQEFIDQLDRIQQSYEIISFKDLYQSPSRKDNSKNSCILTFDDGLIDHYKVVFPILKERNISGCFFPIADATYQRQILDTHRLHAIMARTGDYPEILADILQIVSDIEGAEASDRIRKDFQKYKNKRNYGTREEMFIKELMQLVFSDEPRREVYDGLSRKWLDREGDDLADEFYLDRNQLKEMVRNGMEVGGHSKTHRWLEVLSESEQEKEIRSSLDLVKDILGESPDYWVMSYPFGSRNDRTLDILQEHDCTFAVTTERKRVEIGDHRYQMGRFDGRDFLRSG